MHARPHLVFHLCRYVFFLVSPGQVSYPGVNK